MMDLTLENLECFMLGGACGVFSMTYLMMDSRVAKDMWCSYGIYSRDYDSAEQVKEAKARLQSKWSFGPISRSAKKAILKDLDVTYKELLAKEDVSFLTVEEQAKLITFSDPTPEEMENYKREGEKIRFGAV
jgi:hypothetical protein